MSRQERPHQDGHYRHRDMVNNSEKRQRAKPKEAKKAPTEHSISMANTSTPMEEEEETAHHSHSPGPSVPIQTLPVPKNNAQNPDVSKADNDPP